MKFETAGLVRFNVGGQIYIRRIRDVDGDYIYYYDISDDEAYVTIEEASDQLVYAGEDVKILRTGEITKVTEVRDDSFTIESGESIRYEDYNGKLTFNVIPTPEPEQPKQHMDGLEKIIEDCVSVLEEANYSYKREHVATMVETWWANKKPLIEMLRKHPDWNEAHFAIEGKVSEVREKEDNLFLSAVKTMYGNCRRNGMRLTDAQLDIMWDCVECLSPEKNISKTMVDKYIEMGVEATCGFVPHVGEKYSRVLNKVFKSFGIDKFENYNHDFAVISDAINPIDNKQRCVLSVHPCDFLKMSWGEKWNSCHDIRSRGCYHSGTMSYMMDATSMIFYTVSNTGNEIPWQNNKLTRQIFCYEDGKLLQSRCYPTYELSARCDKYLDFVLSTVKAFTGISDKEWVMHTSDRRTFITTKVGSTHYPDYDYDQYQTRVVVASGAAGTIHIGHQSISLISGAFHSNHETINAESGSDRDNGSYYQDSYYICADCGYKFYQGEGVEYGGYDSSNEEFYCSDHYHICDKCGETIFGGSDDTGVWYGDLWYCDYCAAHHLVRCDRCDEYFDPEEEGGSDDNGYYCQSCIDDADYCDCCETYSWDCDNTYIESEGRSYCPDCLEELFTLCDECNEYVRRDDAHEHDGRCMCPACFAKIKIEETPETPAEAEVSESETAEDRSAGKWRITNSLMRMANPTTAYQMGYAREKFVSSIFDGEIGDLVNAYSVGRVTVYILKLSDDRYVAIQSSGCQKVPERLVG